MWQLIGAILQIIYLIMKNVFERDAEKRKKQEKLYVEAKKAVANRDISSVNSLLVRLRMHSK